MKAAELQEKGAICFDKITDGLKRYRDIKMVMDEKKAYSHFKSLKKEYGADHAYADFYYFRLDEESKEMVDELLSREERDYLQVIKPFPDEVEDEIIFPLDDKLLRIIVRLNAQEMLFSTIYFTSSEERGRSRTTWWGNYENEYICFKDK